MMNIEITATVTECIGNKWFVCVNRYIHGRSFNPHQVMKGFDSKTEAVTFAESYKLTSPVEVKEGGKPFYQDEYKYATAND